MQTAHGCVVQNNRSKSACTLNARKRLNNQAVWPVIFDITGPIGARALNTKIPHMLGSRGHHDWPVMSAYRTFETDPRRVHGEFQITVKSRASRHVTVVQHYKIVTLSRTLYQSIT